MPLLMMIMIVFSLLIFIVTFFISFQSNLFLDALYRSILVFIMTFALLIVSQRVVQMINKKPIRDNQSLEQREMVEKGPTGNPDKEDDSFKGASIDLATPDEDSEFKPLQPRKLNELDD